MIVMATGEHPKLPDKADPFWVTVWFETGFADLCTYLASHARFDQWCDEHHPPKEEE